MLELCVGREGQNSLPHKSRSRVLLGKEKAGNKGMLLDSYRPDLSFSSSVYSFFVFFLPNHIWTAARKLYICTQQCSFSFFKNRTGWKFVSNKINRKNYRINCSYLKSLSTLKSENYRISRFKAIWSFASIEWPPRGKSGLFANYLESTRRDHAPLFSRDA